MGGEEKKQTNDDDALRGRPPPSEAVVEAVAKAKGKDPATLPPLYEVIDPDALDALFRRQEAGRIKFTYAGYEVAVEARLNALVDRIGPELVDPHLCCYDQFFAVDPRTFDALADDSLIAVYLCSIEMTVSEMNGQLDGSGVIDIHRPQSESRKVHTNRSPASEKRVVSPSGRRGWSITL